MVPSQERLHAYVPAVDKENPVDVALFQTGFPYEQFSEFYKEKLLHRRIPLEKMILSSELTRKDIETYLRKSPVSIKHAVKKEGVYELLVGINSEDVRTLLLEHPLLYVNEMRTENGFKR
jgi:hypothetical protein